MDATASNKDGPALCRLFADIIKRTEHEYKCVVVVFTMDADGGSNRGRKDLALERPDLILPSCWAHQVSYIQISIK
jgi:hypothetical protein